MTLTHFSDPALNLHAGDRVTRGELNERFGGGIQGGMLTPAGGQFIFLFSDPDEGRRYGYGLDGWADGPDQKFYYTGEGSVGDQTFTRRNKTLLETRETEREVHLFVAVGTKPGSQAKVHEYLGQFILDRALPFTREQDPNYGAESRTVIVFNLNRYDTEPAAVKTGHIAPVQPAESTSFQVIDPEASNVTSFPRAGVEESTGTRRERDLESKLITWLELQGKTAARIRINIAGQRAGLYTDTWVPEDRELFEVKGSATRNDVRMAIAQLLDYSRHITPPPKHATVVLPAHPGPDLEDLIASCGLNLAIMAEDALHRANHE